jgi:hypothetical protein
LKHSSCEQQYTPRVAVTVVVAKRLESDIHIQALIDNGESQLFLHSSLLYDFDLKRKEESMQGLRDEGAILKTESGGLR